MSTADIIAEKTRTLPERSQEEVLQFVDFLAVRESAHQDGREWAAFATSQLAGSYADADAVYDNA